MFDIGWTELLVIGVVALIVVGPKDLPGMFRTLGRFTAKARTMAREFSRAMEEAADESGVGDVAKDLKKMTSIKNLGLDTIKDAATKFEDWDPLTTTSSKKGPATAALSEERAESARKIHAATAKKATARLAKEAKAAEKAAKPPAKKTSAKKPAAKKPAAKKTAAKAANKPAAKTTAAEKPASKQPAKSKPTAGKPATKRSAK